MDEKEFQRRLAAKRALSLPQDALLAECVEEFFTSGGPGGQHRNKTESGVRLTHPPTELSVTATERRSQARNRGEALERLREVLELVPDHGDALFDYGSLLLASGDAAAAAEALTRQIKPLLTAGRSFPNRALSASTP